MIFQNINACIKWNAYTRIFKLTIKEFIKSVIFSFPSRIIGQMIN